MSILPVELGGVKILIFANRDRAAENDPTHTLFFVDGSSDKAKPAAPAGAARRGYSQRREPARPAVDGGEMANDPIDDLRFGAS